VKIGIPLKVLLPDLYCIRIYKWKCKNFVTDFAFTNGLGTEDVEVEYMEAKP